MSQYPDEQSCKNKWKEIRIKQGVVCPKCDCKEYWWKSDKECFECKCCHHRQSLRSGTIMLGSQLPFRYWFIAMHLLTSTKKSISASELQRQLWHKNYNPIWAMLTGTIELDEGFFSTEVADSEKDKPLRRGRGSQKKSKVLVMAETAEGDGCNTNDRKPTAVKHIKMIVIGDLKSETIDKQVKIHIDMDSIINSDDSTSYTNFKNLVKEHHAQVIPHDQIGKLLPWVHVAISNAKRLLLDIYHDISSEYLKSYLNEFCYKFNRRYFGDGLFDRMLLAGITYKNEFRYNIK